MKFPFIGKDLDFAWGWEWHGIMLGFFVTPPKNGKQILSIWPFPFLIVQVSWKVPESP